ncbi:MAG: hypothetical protein OXG35_19450 [Acidobacteria bacterium]|nr:hypothetical protein [Acidobacteriota bacterium]
MPNSRRAYWRALEDYLRASDNADVVLHDLGFDYFRAIRINGVPGETGNRWILPHFAVVATKQKRRVKAGNRVELVIRRPYYGHLAMREQRIRQEIPYILPPDPPIDDNETGHFEVWKPDNLERKDAWQTDFEWFVENLRLFHRVLRPLVLAALRR